MVENSHTYTSHTLGVVSVTVDPTGTFAASSALDSFIRVWNLQVRRAAMRAVVIGVHLQCPTVMQQLRREHPGLCIAEHWGGVNLH